MYIRKELCTAGLEIPPCISTQECTVYSQIVTFPCHCYYLCIVYPRLTDPDGDVGNPLFNIHEVDGSKPPLIAWFSELWGSSFEQRGFEDAFRRELATLMKET